MLISRTSCPRRDRLLVFSDEAVRKLTMSMLVIVGGRDAMFDSYETAERINSTVPRASVTVLPDVVHSILGQTQPILGFLRARSDSKAH